MKKDNRIAAVLPHSPADALDILPGDTLLEINGQEVIDFLDLDDALAQPGTLHLRFSRDGQIFEKEGQNHCLEPFGLQLEPLSLNRCRNNCIFCFINQLPPHLRQSLYIKDEDYRFSFLYGNYITMTNMEDADFERIARLHLSPLYISVHATQHELHQKMLGRKRVPDILQQLQFLAENDIEFHTQIVLCPEINDGENLIETINALLSFAPHLRSIAIVPVGLSSYRENLCPLRKNTPDEAQKIIKIVRAYQRKCLLMWGSHLIFAADEFYLLSGSGFPHFSSYEDYPQYENGVGMFTFALKNFHRQYHYWQKTRTKAPPPFQKILLLSGASAAPYWQKVFQKKKITQGE